MMTQIKRGLHAVFLAVLALGLSACFDGGSPANNTVSANLAQTSYTTTVGQAITIPVTFNTNTDVASGLYVDLSSLPSGWTLEGGGSFFSCPTISSSGTGCQMDLIYDPTAVTPTSTLSLNYSYENNNGYIENSQFSITYSATAGIFAYVVNQHGGTGNAASVSLCSVSGTGALTDCQYTIGSGLSSSPISIATNTTSGTPYAYILYGATPPNITQCTINSTTGALSGCSSYEPSGSTNFTEDGGFTGITFETFSGTTYAYIAGNYYDSQCTLATSGNIGRIQTCGTGTDTSSPGGFFPNINSIAFGTTDSTTYVYSAAPSDPNLVYSCPMTSAGLFPSSFSSCTSNSFTTTVTDGVAVATAQNGTTYAYVPTGTAVLQCPINSNGTITSTSCSTLGSLEVTAPSKINIEAVGSTNYAYVIDSTNSQIASCPIQTNGSFGTCTVNTGSGGGAFATPESVNFFTPS